jgi:hypothetical protein
MEDSKKPGKKDQSLIVTEEPNTPSVSASMNQIPDLRKILALSAEERSKILETAAESAAIYYEKSDDNLSNLVEDVHDYP